MVIKQYQEISADVWGIFKKYASNDTDLGSFSDDVHALDQKYHEMDDLDAYRFMQKLLKVYFDELGRLRNEQENQS